MLKKLALSTLMLGSVVAFAQTRNDYRNDVHNNYQTDSRSVQNDRGREVVRYRDNDRRDDFRSRERFVPVRRVIGDRRFGYYDRFHHWCWF